MKKKNIILTALLLSAIVFIVKAQKLPNVQETSLLAPATIKVDGKATEWNSHFQAYNKTTEIFYTISNDNNNLYLTVQTTDLDIVNKIVCGGITLTINGTGKMKNERGKSITFPEVTLDKTRQAPPVGFLSMPQVTPNTGEGRRLVDSFIVFFNKEITVKAKDIRVAGIKEIPDSLISIYNPHGIKAALQVDKSRAFTYELAVPLKYLDLLLNNIKSFVYNIKLKGINPETSGMAFEAALDIQRGEIKTGTTTTSYGVTGAPAGENMISIMSPMSGPAPPQAPADGMSSTAGGSYSIKEGVYFIGGLNGARRVSLIIPTEFWGEYTLAK